MTKDNFDKELQQLYQQRKANIEAPELSLKQANETIINKPYSWLGKSTILLVGGLASFGILAIVSFLAKSPVENLPLPPSSHEGVVIKNVVVEKTAEKAIMVKASLPPKPDVVSPPKNNSNIAQASAVSPLESNALNFNVNNAYAVILPDIKQPELAPVAHFKVAPIYPVSEMNKRQAGTIKLAYKIDEGGKVTNIVVLESSVNRVLQRAAKKALKQWQYSPEQALTENYQVVFDFQLPTPSHEKNAK